MPIHDWTKVEVVRDDLASQTDETHRRINMFPSVARVW